ncbi:MAG: hypothetical protein COA58_00645 [Bacteroidetes bacterium]|nr:MAG: hypothetical protein COA58_00645 [Bacteroidota bacterium]
MKRFITTTGIILQVALAFAQLNAENLNLSIYFDNSFSLSAAAPLNYSVEDFRALKDSITVFENEWVYKNMRIYPIVANDSYKAESEKNMNYQSLKEALEKQTIAVEEVTAGGTVNTLKLSNLGKDTIFVMAGEVVLGGKQDRALGQALILAPGDKDVKVSVFCVEHGRWNQGKDGAKFNGYYGFAGNQVRKKVIIDKNQGQVWSKVSEAHNKAGVSSSTQSFKDIKKSEDYTQTMAAYKNYFLPKLEKVENLLGFVVVSGNKILGMEAFASQELLNKQLDKLLESYATEAIQEGSDITVTTDEVDAFMKNALDESKQDQIIKDNGSELKVKGKKLHISVLEK